MVLGNGQLNSVPPTAPRQHVEAWSLLVRGLGPGRAYGPQGSCNPRLAVFSPCPEFYAHITPL